MRLNSIKLSGFKSFAEPTNFVLPGQLVGVVGPNGCGKSNIMDAVRWVLGESRASELRGESMQDVIFNGTTVRKPAGRASVELVFDNADHRAGGQWAQYGEIAVKRVLTRDGASSYYINNQAVRRRDVHDVFLGTGLGPRAYAIIGQGTISRIIESRPEDLRLFLEEAAGVSKYKERRRETEHRLSDTRDNLTRVEDILRELGGQLEKLEQQAEVARRYTALQADATLRQHQLWFLKRAEAGADRAAVHAAGEQAATELQQRVAELRHAESELETLRQAHHAAGEQVHAAQGALYEASAEVGRLEAEIRFAAEGRQRLAQRLAALDEQVAQWTVRRDDAAAAIEELAARAFDAEAQAELLAAQLEEQDGLLPGLEDALREARRQADVQRAAAAQVQQQIQVLAAEQRSLGEQLRQAEARRERLAAERAGLDAPDEAALAELLERRDAAALDAETAEAALQELQESLPQREDDRRQAQQAANREAATEAELSARLDALRTLQAKVQTDGRLQPWLRKHGLADLQALWTRLRIAPGWETALEAALRERMGALEIGRLDMAAAFAADAPPAKLAFFTPPTPAAPAPMRELPGLSPLAARLRLHDAGLQALVAGWLHGCYTAPDFAQAMAARDRLQPGDTVYLPDGHAVGPHSVGFYAQDSEQAGLLARAQEIGDLERQAKAQALLGADARAGLLRAEAALSAAQQQLATARRDATAIRAQAHALQVEALRVSQQAEQARGRGQRIDADLEEIDAQAGELQERRAIAEERFEELDLRLAESQEAHARLDDRALAAERRLQESREQHRALERGAQEAAFAGRSLQAREAELGRTVDTAAQQIAALSAEAALAATELERAEAGTPQDGLQDALARKSERESVLGAARSALDDLAARLRSADERRMQAERGIEPLRQRIVELQLKEQAARLGTAQYDEQLAEAGADLEALARLVEEGKVRIPGMQGEIDRLNREIAALGAVNLAALQELETARERKGFLDSQSADLVEAMTTLEDAIRKIDAETRELLSGTFETVNGHFGRMFPELFGGGEARLIMTGGEILDAGVQVMAQPPGKKNQTIHLLSGGEKALTAIALVFAIFQLNPAPFCLLDEVDAPLDDSNTERYARLVSSMSKGTQFLFISHNKIAMEMAEQLIGVTMQEQGVSRIVAVDMEAALSLADA